MLLFFPIWSRSRLFVDIHCNRNVITHDFWQLTKNGGQQWSCLTSVWTSNILLKFFDARMLMTSNVRLDAYIFQLLTEKPMIFLLLVYTRPRLELLHKHTSTSNYYLSRKSFKMLWKEKVAWCVGVFYVRRIMWLSRSNYYNSENQHQLSGTNHS